MSLFMIKSTATYCEHWLIEAETLDEAKKHLVVSKFMFEPIYSQDTSPSIFYGDEVSQEQAAIILDNSNTSPWMGNELIIKVPTVASKVFDSLVTSVTTDAVEEIVGD